ncbi:class I SAM-dependent methyltransferase [Oligoflexia bacterium]|nr:class I SAM-dependent methyltransferase [Oligoflexia bacterium]
MTETASKTGLTIRTEDTTFDAGSFRDRKSRVFYHKGEVLRGLNAAALNEWKVLSTTTFFKRYCDEGKLVDTSQLTEDEPMLSVVKNDWAAILRHKPIPFISYPYEWSFGMLKDAALLNLELLLSALEEDMILKDSSAFNIQWIAAQPQFIDIPSFEKMQAGQVWVGYRQFCEMFLYPLMLQAYKDMPFHGLLRGCIDGIAPEICAHMMSIRDLLRKGVFTHVYLQSKMQSKYGSANWNVGRDLEQAGFSKELIIGNVKGLVKTINRLRWKRSSSQWADYVQKRVSYSEEGLNEKTSFVTEAVRSKHRQLVWDLGCNTGTFSRIAASNADYVVAMDSDHLAVEALYQALKMEKYASILPLVMNLADPSPNLGWNNLERKALTERGKPDLILCLALLHHLVISANIPLAEVIAWLASLAGDLIIEFVTRKDPMVEKLLQNKEDNYTDFNIDFFENALGNYYRIEKRVELQNRQRVLYYCSHSIVSR